MKRDWRAIKLNEFTKTFTCEGQDIFEREYLDALKFHAPGLAPVQDQSGWYHINIFGKSIYTNRYVRAFGYYNNRASIVGKSGWRIIDETGVFINDISYKWTGNFQETLCVVRTQNDKYHHINLAGKKVYETEYQYVGDFKYSFACVMNEAQSFTHIDKNGDFLHNKWYKELGIYHKGFATAKDADGWMHIDFAGTPIYSSRFDTIEPFYNGFAFATSKDGKKVIVDEEGRVDAL